MVTYGPWTDGPTHVFDDDSETNLRAWEPNISHPSPQLTPPVSDTHSRPSNRFGFYQATPGPPVMDSVACAGSHARLGSTPQGGVVGGDLEPWTGTCPTPEERAPGIYTDGGSGGGVYYGWEGGNKLDEFGNPGEIAWTYGFQHMSWSVFGLNYPPTTSGPATTQILPYGWNPGGRAGGADWNPANADDLRLTRVEFLGYQWTPLAGSYKQIEPLMYLRLVRDGEQRQGWWGSKFPGDSITIQEWSDMIGPIVPLPGSEPFDLADDWVAELPTPANTLPTVRLEAIVISAEFHGVAPLPAEPGVSVFAGGVASPPHLRFHFQSADYRLVYDTAPGLPLLRQIGRDDRAAARIFPSSSMQDTNRHLGAYY